MAPAVLLRSAVAITGRFPALAGADLTVDEGEAILLTGPNGAGKTSLLRVCAGLLRLTGGEALVLGHDLVSDPVAVRREVAMLGHSPALYDDLSVAENVRFAVRASGGDTRTVPGALERLGLVGRLPKTAAGRLSAGQRKRVGLAVVIARGARLWLLDEPHASLDAGARAELDEIVAEAVSGGATVIAASHEPGASTSMAARVVSMGGGRVVPSRQVPVSPGRRMPGVLETSAGPDSVAGRAVVTLSGGPHVA
jgi:heme ABC exporter ATP-binding subunit CcmA